MIKDRASEISYPKFHNARPAVTSMMETSERLWPMSRVMEVSCRKVK
jgi:hypothetical protein